MTGRRDIAAERAARAKAEDARKRARKDARMVAEGERRAKALERMAHREAFSTDEPQMVPCH